MSEKNVKDLGFQTRAVHTGNGVDGETGAIKRPITMQTAMNCPMTQVTLTGAVQVKTFIQETEVQTSSICRKRLPLLRAAKIAWCLQAVLPLCRDCSLLYSKAVTM